MVKVIGKSLKSSWQRLRSDRRGFVLVSSLIIFLFLFVLCASIYAVGETIHQKIKIQNACDAAAYSAAVIQADGLSRMAIVNRAMAWNYVQMTNRQMDYITYRWLKLTCKRFAEDRDNAHAYAEQLIMAVDYPLGLAALLEGAATGVLNAVFDQKCSSGNHSKKHEGLSWWCGLEPGVKHAIEINQKNCWGLSFDLMKDKIGQISQNELVTYDNLSRILNLVKIIDSKANPKNPAAAWGARLGKLIDWDKANIQRLNNTLPVINVAMNLSMRVTAENVLKTMLKDRRSDPDQALEDYYISVKIPKAKNPYDLEHTTDPANSYFSPLRNTEADEMLFLNMLDPEKSSNTLAQHFPILAPKSNLALGLDQWFIRGTAHYSDQDPEHCFDPVETSNAPPNCAMVKDGVSLTGTPTTERHEGALGIQRVYKDTNLNEGKVGFLNRKKKTVTQKVWLPTAYLFKDSSSSRRQYLISQLPPCCQKHVFGGKHGRVFVGEHYHETQVQQLEDARVVVSRGNHICNFNSLINASIEALNNFLNGGGAEDSSSSSDEDIDDLSQIKQHRDELIKENIELSNQRAKTTDPVKKTELDKQIQENEDNIAKFNQLLSQSNSNSHTPNNGSPQAPGGGSGDPNDDTSPDSGGGSQEKSGLGEKVKEVFNSLIKKFLGAFTGDVLDIFPSTDNIKGDFKDISMCSQASDTTALYSEYRWAACKYYCLTTGLAYAACLLRGKDIYCDIHKKKIGSIGNWEIKIHGWGHYGLPQYFCGKANSYGFLDELLKYVPPFLGPLSNTHGYTDSLPSLDDHLKPLKPLISQKNTNITRDEYRSCAMFLDGNFIPSPGSNSPAGIIQGHSRIYADDREIFDNRYVGAICRPWVLNEKFFSGAGTIVVGAAMKHTNPFVQLFNFWNSHKSATPEKQSAADQTVLAAFNIPQGNYIWTMSAARAGVRHRRRNGIFDQERQYQITYDSTSDVENLGYNQIPVLLSDKDQWVPLSDGFSDSNNPQALSRADIGKMTMSPIWNGCPCKLNDKKFRDMWNLCEADWDATLLPLHYALLPSQLMLSANPSEKDSDKLIFNEQDYDKRQELLSAQQQIDNSSEQEQPAEVRELMDNDQILGNGRSWQWQSFVKSNPFAFSMWKKATLPTGIPGYINPLVPFKSKLNLKNRVPTGDHEHPIDLFSIFRNRVL